MSIVEQLESQNSQVDYAPHKKFAGVYMLHLVTGEQTEGRFSSHLIKVDPSCMLDVHVHPEQIEVHQVVQGTAECQIGDTHLSYAPGVVAVIPQNVPHKVEAGSEGLYMLAQFTPALL